MNRDGISPVSQKSDRSAHNVSDIPQGFIRSKQPGSELRRQSEED